jgi:hypothetical protein
LHSGNYTSWAPSLTGSGASGNWGINVTGNAATATKATNLNQARHVNIDFNTLGSTGQFFRAYTNYIPSGGSYNQPPNGSGDYKVIQWGDVEGGDGATAGNWAGQIVQNFYDDRMWFRRSYGTTWQAWREFIHDGNYTNYAMPAGASATNSVDIRAPIFYDSNNTGFYVDPAGTSQIANIRTGNVINIGGILGDASIAGTSFHGIELHVEGNRDYYIGKPAGAWTQPLHIHFYTGIWYRAHSTFGGHKFYNISDGGLKFSVADGDNHVRVYSNLYAPIYYDIDDTNYYVNPAGSSVLYSVEMINQRCSFSRQWDNYPGISVYNTTDQGPQGDFRIFGSVGANGGDFSVRLLVDGNVQSLADLVAGGALRAPIYYDTDNTGYYDNPAGTSNLYRIYANDKFYARGNVGVDECCGSDATISVGGSSTRPPSISWHYSGVMQGNMQGNQTGWRKIYFYDDQGSGLGVHATGQIASNADVIAYYSDRRLKKDLVRVIDHWNVINNLTGYRFTWNEKSGEIDGFRDKVGKREVGLMAQDVKAVYPEAIAMRTEGPEDDPYMTIKHDRFTAVFVEALKDLRRELDEVKEENKKLREMINGQ